MMLPFIYLDVPYLASLIEQFEIISRQRLYLVTGIVLTCDGGISVAPNMRMTTFENETEALTEYKVNFQFKF